MNKGKVVGLAFAFLFVALITVRGVIISEDVAVRALENQGYSNVEVVDKSWFMFGLIGCGREDAAKFEVVATNPAGEDTELIVCTGWPVKSSTIRSR